MVIVVLVSDCFGLTRSSIRLDLECSSMYNDPADFSKVNIIANERCY